MWLLQAVSRLGLCVVAFLGLCFAASAAETPPGPEFSVYRGPGCIGRERIASFEKFAGRKVQRTVDALNQQTWQEMRSSIPWVISCWKGSSLKLTLSVPMLTFHDTGTLADGAAGRYDDVFLTTARHLMANDFSDAIIRIAWEFNGDWMPWRADKDPKSYVAYFRRIVALMRSVPGQRFKFEWTPNHGKHKIEPPSVYPGDDCVDIVGMDVYDEVWNDSMRDPIARWTYYKNQPFGLAWHRDFAAAHAKPMAYSEWGVGTRPDGHGSGDDPYFVEQMANWIATVKPLYHNYWDDPSPTYDAELSTGRFPRAAEAFKKAFGNSAR
jgi:hypothetical protein